MKNMYTTYIRNAIAAVGVGLFLIWLINTLMPASKPVSVSYIPVSTPVLAATPAPTPTPIRYEASAQPLATPVAPRPVPTPWPIPTFVPMRFDPSTMHSNYHPKLPPVCSTHWEFPSNSIAKQVETCN